MFPFKRKKEEKEDVPEAKPIRRRKKKAEPVKPWGKLERFIVFVFLVSAPLLSITFLIKSHNAGPQVLGSVITVNPRDTNVLKEELTNEIKNQNGTYGFWIQSIDNSYSLGINEKELFDGASLFKLPLMIGYYQEVDRGKVDPNASYTLKYSDAAAGAGILSNLPAGTVVTYRDMVADMGKDSDNAAFSIMSGILPLNEETSVITKIGMKSTDFNNSVTTPYDIGLLFYKLVNGELISNTSKEQLLSSLSDTAFENLIPAATPDNIRIVHKYATDDGELNDAGIVYTNKPFILVIMSKDIKLNEASIEIPKLAKIVYDWATR